MQDVNVCWHIFFPCQHNLPLYGSLDQTPFDFCLPQNESEGDHHGDTSAAKDGALMALSKRQQRG